MIVLKIKFIKFEKVGVIVGDFVCVELMMVLCDFIVKIGLLNLDC